MSQYISYSSRNSGGGGGGGSPTGPAGGDLSGTYPNPTIPANHSTPFQIASYNGSGDLGPSPALSTDANGQLFANLTGTLPLTTITQLDIFGAVSTSLSGGYEGIIVGPNLSSTATFTSMFNAETNFDSGYSNSGGATIYQDQSNFNSGSSTQNYISYGSFPNFHSGSTIQSFDGARISPTLNGTVSSNFTGMQISPSGASVVPNIRGLVVNLTGGGKPTTSDPEGPISFESDSRISVNAQVELASSLQFMVVNRLEGLIHTSLGSPITGTDSLGNDLAGDIWCEDNVADGPTAGIVGVTGVGFISSVVVGSGKTVDTANVFLAGSALPDPGAGHTFGGTITNLSMIKTFPPLSEGGTLNVTNLKAVNIAGTFTGAGTNVWGLYVEDILLANHIGGSLDLGSLKMNGSTSGQLTHNAAATTTSYTLTWPAAQGAANSVLANNGSGVLSWAQRANTALSNLASTQINANLNPASSNTIKLGSSGARFLEAHITGIYAGTPKIIDVSNAVYNDVSGTLMLDGTNYTLGQNGVINYDFLNSLINDSTGVLSIDVQNRRLIESDGATVALDYSTGVGFFGTSPAGQQTGGAATAGILYTATEQAMLQKVYDALRTFGLLS